MEASLLKDILPSENLRNYVRKYQVFRFLFDESTSPPIKFHAPRPEHCITFYIRDPQRFSYHNSPVIYTYPPCVIHGMYTIPIHRHGGKDFLAIKVILQPSVLFQLIHFSLTEITNNYINAADIWGSKIDLVCEQLKNLTELNQMLCVIETFLKQVLLNNFTVKHPIDKAADYLLVSENGASLHWLASQSCLSLRHFIRKFEERNGIGSKTFQRIIRFDKAFRMKNTYPHLDWFTIALSCNYNDYQHMVKDFKDFTYLTPPAFFELEKTSPERSFGLIEA